MTLTALVGLIDRNAIVQMRRVHDDWSKKHLSSVAQCWSRSILFNISLHRIAFARTSCWRLLLCKPRMSWACTWWGERSCVQCGQSNAQSLAVAIRQTTKSLIDSVSPCTKFENFILWTAGLVCLVTIASSKFIASLSFIWKKSCRINYCVLNITITYVI